MPQQDLMPAHRPGLVRGVAQRIGSQGPEVVVVSPHILTLVHAGHTGLRADISAFEKDLVCSVVGL